MMQKPNISNENFHFLPKTSRLFRKMALKSKISNEKIAVLSENTSQLLVEMVQCNIFKTKKRKTTLK